MKFLRPGGVYVFVGMVHPDSKLDVTGEQIIRKCITVRGKKVAYVLMVLRARTTASQK